MGNRVVISSGIIIWKIEDGKVKFFVCSPGGPLWKNRQPCWNFPKGQLESDESPFEGAVREFTEETSIRPASLIESDYTYHGIIKQRSNKSVHVFSRQWDGEELGGNCHSNIFRWKDGHEYPEIEKYQWLTYDEIYGNGVAAYYNIFKEIEVKALNKNNI